MAPKDGAWNPPSCRPPDWLEEASNQAVQIVEPEHLAALYRALRKASEDSKDEPGAADFYYGEMEMRRLSSATPAVERVLLNLYWMISGYSLRGLRSLGWLGIVAVAAAFLYLHVGFSSQTTFGDSLVYSAQSILSIENRLRPLQPAGEVLKVVLRLVGPLLLGLTLLSVRNRVKR
jgi:hypothetical protein